MKQTISEKIISRASGKQVKAGEIAVVKVDGAMATDATAPLAIKAFEKMGGTRLWDPERVSWVIDHAAPAPNEIIANLHRLMRLFAEEHGGHFYDVGQGICHQLMVENGHVKPGEIFVGADSHTPTYGALNAFAIGVGSTDLAAVLLTGKIWLKVPETIRIELNGSFRPEVSAKDLILFLLGELGISGATYKAVEFGGTALVDLTLASRMTLANMTAEMGAKTGLVDPNGLALADPFEMISADQNADYSDVFYYDVSTLRPMIAAPHFPDKVRPVDEVAGVPIQQAFIGSCTNARLEDLQIAARILEGRKVATSVRLIIAPASKRIFEQALQDGSAAVLSEAGAAFITSGCGPCVGTHQGVPADDEVIISSTNRNFRGRMGNPNAKIYLGSPATVAASAVTGQITNPVEMLAGEGLSLEL